MCFSNLPIEFDEAGDPYLAEEADDVSDPGSCDHAPAADCGCGTGAADDAPLQEVDPEDAFEDILDSLSAASRAHLTERNGERGASTRPDRTRDSAEGD